MTFTLNLNQNLQDFMRTAGYKPIAITTGGELNCVRPLAGDYPRFHVYAKESSNGVVLNLHLDQKRPSYGEETAHSGEYDGELVQEERERIESFAKGGGTASKPWWQK